MVTNDFRKDNIDFMQKAFMIIIQAPGTTGMTAVSVPIDRDKLKANTSAELGESKQQFEQWVKGIETDIKNILNEAWQTGKEEDENYKEKRGDEFPEDMS